MRRVRRALVGLGAVSIAAFTLVSPARAFDAIPPMPSVHQEITREALGGGAIMADDALKRVIDAVVASDLHQLSPERHFDNAPTPEAVCMRWREGVDQWFKQAVGFVGPGDAQKRTLQDRMAALERFGWVAHAIQDFYSHSNYVELSQAGPIPPVDQLLLSACGPLPPAIQTGFFDLRYGLDGCPPLIGGPPQPPAPYGNCHAQLNKDNARRPNFTQARAFAVAATKAAWEELHGRIIAKYADDATTDAECLFMKLARGTDSVCRRSP